MRGLLSERSHQKPQQGGAPHLIVNVTSIPTAQGKTGQPLANPYAPQSRINLPMRRSRDQHDHSKTDQTWTVVDHFPDAVPVTPEELDLVEAFLMAQFRAIMEDEGAARDAGLPALDSELPQIHAAVRTIAKGRRNRR